MKKINDYNGIEKLVHDSIIDNKVNHLTSKIDQINQILSCPTLIEKPSNFGQILNLVESNNRNVVLFEPKKNYSKKILFSLAAAALILIGVMVQLNFVNSPSESTKSTVAYAKVVWTEGEVAYGTNSNLSTLTKDKHLEINQQISTTSNSSAEVRFLQNSTIVMKPNTTVIIEKLGSLNQEKIRVHITNGLIIANVTKREEGSSFEISTPNFIVTVKGTKFFVNVSNQLITCGVDSGKISVSRRDQSNPNHSEINLESRQLLVETPDKNLERMYFPEDRFQSGEKLSELILQIQTGIYDKNFKDLKKLELIRLEDQSIIKGITVGIDDEYLQIQTQNGIMKIKRSQILYVENLK